MNNCIITVLAAGFDKDRYLGVQSASEGGRPSHGTNFTVKMINL